MRGVSTTAASGESTSAPQAIFLVHGRDRAALLEVEMFLSKVTDLDVVVLGDQPSQGQTIIEKLSTYMESSAFAVVLMTADDEGRLRVDENDLSFRARQNVILELGYAIGRLGRNNVAVLHEDGVELPSDYYGVVYTAFDSGGGWKLTLLGELQAAGIQVDANRVLR